MKQSYRRKWGFSDADAPFVDAFEASQNRLGVPRARIEQAFDWFAHNVKRGMSRDAMLQSFDEFTKFRDWKPAEFSAALTYHDLVSERGLEAIELDNPTREQDLARLGEIRALGQRDRLTPETDDEHLEILERLEKSGEDLRALRVPAASGDTAVRSSRRAELESLMRTDRNAYFRTGADKELAGILEADRGGDNPNGRLAELPAPAGGDAKWQDWSSADSAKGNTP